MRRRFRQWWNAAVAAAAILSPHPAAADQPVHDIQVAATPDFTLIALPTALRVPRFKSAFRVTHRFTQPLNASVGDVAGNLFGLDSGAQIGLEYGGGLARANETMDDDDFASPVFRRPLIGLVRVEVVAGVLVAPGATLIVKAGLGLPGIGTAAVSFNYFFGK